ncbi:CRISPR-associated protein Cas2 [Thermogutta terrifontis]|jgi:CRISPR-associated protein Cas2|uniref:CRISPR-associated endoribonuclease Cas2 n=1 Tax=Thermogutta terrifontis TaxID=1331910 RepID=A0A286RH69_9BACT|nr:CRISPR-associated endonuclease Cas2 [Thermogutta terrifontis]ASV75315.1 CRISPR-associated protein Cas2 [Thermogutta terrifontis]
MPRGDLPSGYKIMWLFVLFDLPMDDRKARREYTRFRKRLLEMGFCQLQYSVYARPFPSEEAMHPYRQEIRANLPPKGAVRLLPVTDRQFGKMENYVGKIRQENEKAPRQLMLF